MKVKAEIIIVSLIEHAIINDTFTISSISSNENQIIISGQTNFIEPIIYSYDLKKNNLNDLNNSYLFKSSYKYKQCKPYLYYDKFLNLLFVTFKTTADLITLNITNNFGKEALYHSVDDTFFGFNITKTYYKKKRNKSLYKIFKKKNTTNTSNKRW